MARESAASRHAVLGVSLALVGTFALAAALVLRRRAHPVVKAAAAAFLLVELLGCGLAAAAAAVSSRGRGSSGVCAAVPLLASLAFVLVVLPPCLRAWRLHKIFSSVVAVVRIRTARLLGIVAVAAAAEAALHAARALADPSHTRHEPATAGSGAGAAEVADACRGADGGLWLALLLAPKAALLVWALALAYRTRLVVPDEFNESRTLVVTVLLVALGGTALGVALSDATALRPTARLVTVASALCGTAALVAALTSGARLWESRSGAAVAPTSRGSSGGVGPSAGGRTSARTTPTTKFRYVRQSLPPSALIPGGSARAAVRNSPRPRPTTWASAQPAQPPCMPLRPVPPPSPPHQAALPPTPRRLAHLLSARRLAGLSSS